MKRCPRCHAEIRHAGHVCADEEAPGETEIERPALNEVMDDRWKLGPQIGQGSMSLVFLGWDLRSGEKVAVKLLAPQLVKRPRFIARFEREARIMAALRHPSVISLFAVGRRGTTPYLVMPYLEGVTLSEYLARWGGRLNAAEVIRITEQTGAGLSCLHAQGLVHRDVKPGNVFIGKDGRITLLDLGLAVRPIDSGLTRPGARLGTPHYMPPEQALGLEDIDARADQYALAAVVYEMLAGAPPFPLGDINEVLRAHRDLPRPDACLRTPWLPREAGAVIARGMGRTPGERYPTVAAFVEALRMALSAVTEQVQIAPPPSAVDTLAQEDDSTQRMAEPATDREPLRPPPEDETARASAVVEEEPARPGVRRLLSRLRRRS